MNWIKRQFKKMWKWTLGVLGIGAVVALTFNGAVIEESFELDGKTVTFSYEDSKVKENLFIKTNANSFSVGSDIYMSIQNNTASDLDITIVFSVKDSETYVYDFKEFVSNEDIIHTASKSPEWTERRTNWSDKTKSEPDTKVLADSIKSDSRVSKKSVVGEYNPGFTSFITSGETKYYKFRINAPLNPQIDVETYELSQEFYIEVFGNSGYGHIY